jgi:hypothetical protein
MWIRAKEAAIATRRAVARRVVEASERSAAEIERSVAKGSIVVPRLRRAYVDARISVPGQK